MGRRYAVSGLVVLAAVAAAYAGSTLLRTRVKPDERPIVLKDVRVQVLNGCGARGAGQKVANMLRLNGFDVVEVGNARSFDYPTTLVLDRVGRLGRAQEIADVLGRGDVLVQRIEGSPYDATVIVGKDFRLEGLP